MKGAKVGKQGMPQKQRRAPLVRARATTKRHACQTQEEEKSFGRVASKVASAGLAALVASSPVCGAAIASEFDVLDAPVPETSYVVDDGSVLSKAGKGALVGKLRELEKTTGYHLNVVTMRKLQFTPDPFEFSDKVLENWYPTLEQGNNKGVLLVISSTKEGAISGGPDFLNKVGDDVLDSIISETIPDLAKEEKFNEASLRSVQRITAVLQGKEDPGAPKASLNRRIGAPKKSKEEVQANFNFIFKALVVIIIGTPLAQTILSRVIQARNEEQ